MIQRLFHILLLAVLTSCTTVITPSAPDLSGKIRWQGEVRLRGDIVVAKEAELTIAPGTRVVFEVPRDDEDRYREHPFFVGSELIVRGRLHARGTPEHPIVFEAADSAGGPGSWGGINVEDAPEVEFSHCVFRQADSAVHARNTHVSIDHSLFEMNHVGVRFHDTVMRIENNRFENNDTALRFHFGAPVIRRNLIRHNRKGLFISTRPQDYLIENNSFIDNRPYQVNLGEGVRRDVDLRHNYWGGATGADLERFFFDARLDDWLGRIEYLPVLEAPPVMGPAQ